MPSSTPSVDSLPENSTRRIRLADLEAELKKRLRAEPFLAWGRKQSNTWDRATDFIYQDPYWDSFQIKTRQLSRTTTDPAAFYAYAVNRWFNYWSAKGVEHIFARQPGVKPATATQNQRLHVDFELHGLQFDHKTTVYPRNFSDSLQQSQQNPKNLVKWLYKNQSRQQRFHLKNRLFIVLYKKDYNHWQLRAQLSWLQTIITNYVAEFQPNQLITLNLQPDQPTFTDIIWAVQ